MRIKLKTKCLGDCKVIRRFTLFPMLINDSEISWLEWVYIVRKIRHDSYYNGSYSKWLSVDKNSDFEMFTDKEHYLKCKEYIKENKLPQGKIRIHVARDAISKMTGQKRCNILMLKEMGYDAKITADSKTGKYQLYIIRNEEL